MSLDQTNNSDALARASVETQSSSNSSSSSSSSSASSSEPRALDLMILADHAKLRAAMNELDGALLGNDTDKAQRWYHKFIREAAQHSVAEELVLYPWLEQHNGREWAERSRAEHQGLKLMLHNLERTEFGDEAFRAQYADVKSALLAHIAHEESDEVPMFVRQTTDAERMTMGKKFKMMRAIVPTRPHPRVPNRSAVMETFLGVLIAPLDRLRDLARSFPDA